MSIFKKVINLFNKKQDIKDNKSETIDNIFNSNEYSEDIMVDINNLDKDKFGTPVIENPNGKLTLLIMDDVEESEYLFNIDFKTIKEKYGFDVYDKFKIVKCYGKYAGFMAHQYIKDHPIIDYAFLDITLGTSIKLNSGKYLEYDGIDIALKILKHNKMAEILFITAHTFNYKNSLMKDYFNKFESNTNLYIGDYYLNKNDDRVKRYVELFHLDLKK